MSQCANIQFSHAFVLSHLRTFVLSCFFLFCGTVKSQIINTFPYEFTCGVSAGTTFARVSFNPHVTQGYAMGMTYGVTGRMTMGKNVGLQLEINYAQQGWKENYSETETPQYQYERKFNYIQVPFLTHVQFGGENMKGFINAGPQFGLFLNESTSSNLDGGERGIVNFQHTMPVEKKFEWGIGGGPGIEIRTGIGYFLIEGRYFYSFSDIYSTQRRDVFAKASTQTITAKITYLLPVK